MQTSCLHGRDGLLVISARGKVGGNTIPPSGGLALAKRLSLWGRLSACIQWTGHFARLRVRVMLCFLQNALLQACHFSGFGGGVVVPAGEVEESVDEVEGDLAGDGLVLSVLGGLAGGGLDADEDLAVMKSDDVGGGGVVQELAMHMGDFGVGDEGDLDGFQLVEHCGAGFGDGKAAGQGGFGQLAEALWIHVRWQQGGGVIADFEMEGGRGGRRE